MSETCLVCHGTIEPAELARCTCGTPYHRDCRSKLGKCLAARCESEAAPEHRFREMGGERAVECVEGSGDLLALVSSSAPALPGHWVVRDAQGSLHFQSDDRRWRIDTAAGLSVVARSVHASSRVELRDRDGRTLTIREQPIGKGPLGALARRVAAFLELPCEVIFERTTQPAEATHVAPRVATKPVAGDCQYCGIALAPDPTVLCPACETPHHADCWQAGGGCTTYACTGRAALVPASAEVVSLRVSSGEIVIEDRRLRIPASVAREVPALPPWFIAFQQSVPALTLVGLGVTALPFLFLPVGGELFWAAMLAFPVTMVSVSLLAELAPRPGPAWLELQGETMLLASRGHRWPVAWQEDRKIHVVRKPRLRLAQVQTKKQLAYELTLQLSGSRSLRLAGPLLAPRQAGEARGAFLRELAEIRRFAVAASQALGLALEERYALTARGDRQARR